MRATARQGRTTASAWRHQPAAQRNWLRSPTRRQKTGMIISRMNSSTLAKYSSWLGLAVDVDFLDQDLVDVVGRVEVVPLPQGAHSSVPPVMGWDRARRCGALR